MSESGYTEVKAVCRCGKLSVSVQVPTEDLPAEVWLCSCTSCRKLSGHLATTNVRLPKSWKDLSIRGKPSRYTTSDGPAGLTRCFCSTCGALICDDSPDRNRIGLFAGCLTRVDGIVDLRGIIHTADTRDGGISEWLPNLKSYDADTRDPGPYKPHEGPIEPNQGEKLHCRCLCGGVEFWVTRPGPESTVPTFFVNDCFEPDYDQSQDTPPNLNWWIRGNGKKYAALLCMCNSCREATGGDIQPWGYVPLPNMVQKDGSPLDFQMGSLTEYRSSEGIRRYFCGKCSACVFFVRDGDLLIDLSLGIVDAESGARAEEWFAWTHIVCYTEFAQNKVLAQELETGMIAWEKRTGKSTRHERKVVQ